MLNLWLTCPELIGALGASPHRSVQADDGALLDAVAAVKQSGDVGVPAVGHLAFVVALGVVG
jgi:hypothetical protein